MNNPNSAGTPYARNLTVVKNYFRKPLTLVVCILTLSTFLLNLLTTSQMNELTAQLYKLANIDAEPGSNILSIIISGVVILCFFMIYFFSLSSSGNPYPFFKTLHVMSVIELVLCSIISVLSVVVGLIAIFASNSLLAQMPEASIDPTQADKFIEIYRVTLIIMLVVMVAILALFLFFINSQTAFLKSCARSCREPSLFTKGAKPFGVLSILSALLQLVGVVVLYLLFSGSSEVLADYGLDLTSLSFPKTFILLSVLSAAVTMLKGILAQGWVKFAEENRSFVDSYNVSAAASRSPEANPISTFNSNTRRSNDAVTQSQPYLYGEEENQDSNKKSSYIPEELQNDYPQQFDQLQNPFAMPMQYGQPQDPFGGDPFAMPMQPPMQNDPFAQSPMGNPYGQPPMPNDQNPYNNGMM